MKKKNTYSIYAIILSALVLIALSALLFIKPKSKEVDTEWSIYFAPTSTDVMYGSKDAKLVEVDSHRNLAYHSTKAYPFSGMLNYKDDIIFQSPTGLDSIKSKVLNKELTKDIDTVGYNMSGTIKNDELFYFLLNESFKEEYYSSQLVIGNAEKQYLHQVKGFINAYGNDNDNIYLLVSDMENKYLKQIQKISINSEEDINIEANNVIFDTIVESDNNVIVNGDYIYCFTIKENFGVSLLKISINTLTVEDTFDLIKFDFEEDNDKYYPVSTNSIFCSDNKIFYPTKEGIIYSFNIENNEFNEEFTMENYDLSSSMDILGSYNEVDKEINFLYFDNKEEKYCISTYDLSGNLKNSFYIDNLEIKNNLYPHSFIKKN